MLFDWTPEEESELDSSEYLSVVMFMGEHCGPCKASMPHYEMVEKHFRSTGYSVRFYVVDTGKEENHPFCIEHEVIGVPKWIHFYEGKPIFITDGFHNSRQLNDEIVDSMIRIKEKMGVTL